MSNLWCVAVGWASKGAVMVAGVLDPGRAYCASTEEEAVALWRQAGPEALPSPWAGKPPLVRAVPKDGSFTILGPSGGAYSGATAGRTFDDTVRLYREILPERPDITIGDDRTFTRDGWGLTFKLAPTPHAGEHSAAVARLREALEVVLADQEALAAREDAAGLRDKDDDVRSAALSGQAAGRSQVIAAVRAAVARSHEPPPETLGTLRATRASKKGADRIVLVAAAQRSVGLTPAVKGRLAEGDRVPFQDFYRSSQLRRSLAHARTLAPDDNIRLLSARYGLNRLSGWHTQVTSDDVPLDQLGEPDHDAWAWRVRRELLDEYGPGPRTFVVLAGSRDVKALRDATPEGARWMFEEASSA